LRAIFENVPQVSIAGRTHYLDPCHAMRFICFRPHRVSSQRQPETWPTRARVILVLRAEERRIATNASIRAICLVVDKFSGKRSLRRRALCDLELLRTEPATQAFVVPVTHSSHLIRYRATAYSYGVHIRQGSPAASPRQVAHGPARYVTTHQNDHLQTLPINVQPEDDPR